MKIVKYLWQILRRKTRIFVSLNQENQLFLNLRLKSKQPCDGGSQKTNQDSHSGGNQKGKNGPLKAFCFLPNRQAGGGAGEMHQGEERHTQCRYPGPAVRN